MSFAEEKKTANPASDVRIDQLILAHENERQLTVYEIHDGVIQYLVASMMHLESARAPERIMDETAVEQLDHTWRFLSRSLQEARALMNSIAPPILGEKGIVAAIEHLIADSRLNHPADVTFKHDVAGIEFSAVIQATLFRVAQQALSNIWQHADAESVAIELTSTPDEVQLSINDSGCGFDLDSVDDGIGLQSMRSRVTAFSGHLSIESSESGTTLVATLPTIDQIRYESVRRAKAETGKQQANERLQLALRATTDAIWDCDLRSGLVQWNDGYDRLFGERPPNTKDSWEWWIDHIHSDDRDRVVTSIKTAAGSNPEYGDRWCESYLYKRGDGTYASIRDEAFIARGEDGVPTRIVGCMREISREHTSSH